MSRVTIKCLLVLLLCCPALIQAQQLHARFDSLLQEAGLVFSMPDEYKIIDADKNALFPYEHAIRRKDNALEVRYSIRPLSRIEIDYEDPHNAAPEPNHIFTMMFTALIGQLSNGGSSPHREYKTPQAMDKFNADWAALSVFDVEASYSADFKQAFLLALHKNNVSDAYLIILFNDYKDIKPQLEQAMQSLRFE